MKVRTSNDAPPQPFVPFDLTLRFETEVEARSFYDHAKGEHLAAHYSSKKYALVNWGLIRCAVRNAMMRQGIEFKPRLITAHPIYGQSLSLRTPSDLIRAATHRKGTY